MSRSSPSRRKEPTRIAQRRGGPSTFGGTEYQVLVAQVEALRLLPDVVFKPQCTHRVTMEHRVILDTAHQVGFDIRTEGVREALLEVKLNPTLDDLVEWISNARLALPHVGPDTEFLMVHDKENAAVTALLALVDAANEAEDNTQLHERRPRGERVDGMLAALGPDARAVLRRLRVVNRPTDAEQRLGEDLARQLCPNDASAQHLLEHLRSVLAAAAKGRRTVELQAVQAELAAHGITLTVPAGQAGIGLDPAVRGALAVATRCQHPLPLVALASALDVDVFQLQNALTPFVSQDGLAKDPPIVEPTISQQIDDPDLLGLQRRVLQAVLSLSERPEYRRSIRGQLRNIVGLARAVVSIDPELVAQMFPKAEKLFKTAGNLHLAMAAAQVSLSASFSNKGPGGITDQMLRDRAQTQICGISWVHQRTGDLGAADHFAQQSLDLGEALGWERNTAYCLKCIGRLRRLQSERAVGEERGFLLEQSEDFLRRAISAFMGSSEFGPRHQEVADCRSLLGRTLLMAGRRREAAKEVTAAMEILEAMPGEKDWADATILDAELLAADGEMDGAMSRLGDVLAYFNSSSQSGEPSEIAARALMTRARLFLRRSQREAALSDLHAAEELFSRLEDPERQAESTWEAMRIRGDVPEELADLLTSCRPLVAVTAVHIYNADMAPKTGTRGRRAGMSFVRKSQIMAAAEQEARRRETLWQ